MEVNPELRAAKQNDNFKKAIKLGVIYQLYKDKELTDVQFKKLIYKNEDDREMHSI